jgi:hypothetical protein
LTEHRAETLRKSASGPPADRGQVPSGLFIMSAVQMDGVCVHVLLLLPPRLGILDQLISGKRLDPSPQEYTALKRCYHVLYTCIYVVDHAYASTEHCGNDM